MVQILQRRDSKKMIRNDSSHFDALECAIPLSN